MILLKKHLPLRNQLRFMEANIRQIPGPSELEKMCQSQEPSLIRGLLEFRSLLKKMYAGDEYLEGKDNDAKFKGFCETMLLLYTCAAFGRLEHRDGQQAITINKEALLSKFKKGSLSKKAQLLMHHGLIMEWLSSSGDSVAQSKASDLSVTFPENDCLLPAIKYFATTIDSIDDSDSGQTVGLYTDFSFESISNKLEIFSKADFEAAFMRTSLTRDTLDPLREDIVATTGKHRQSWVRLVDELLNQYGLKCFGSFYFGMWGVSFHRKGQRPFLIFTLAYEVLFVELTLPVDAAESIVKQRSKYSKPIQEGMESFGCVQCPKKCKGQNLLKMDGITMCKGRAEGRRIYTVVSTDEDFSSIEAIARIAFTR